MKKLITALFAVSMAIGAHAAAANWQASAANIYDGKGDSAAKWSGTAYIFDASITAQAAMYDLFAAGSSIGSSTAGFVASDTISNGILSSNTAKFSYGEQAGGNYSYYFVLVDGDNIYLSKTVTAAANGTEATKGLSFGSQAPATGATSVSLPTDGFVSVGQWAAIPEPTSGLLLLLGMAGLVLRCRRA